MCYRPMIWLCVLSCVVVCGCSLPASKYPITPLSAAKQDALLPGVWKHEEKDQTLYLHVGGAGDDAQPGLMRCGIVSHRRREDGPAVETPGSALFFVSQVAGKHFVNLMPPVEEGKTEKPEGDPSYLLLRYKVDGDRLSLWHLDGERVAAAIDSGEVSGTVVREEKRIKSVTLTGHSEELARFFATPAADSLFPGEGTVLHRLR